MSRVPGYLKFKYTNWRGDDHEYVLEPEPESLAAHDYSLEDGSYEFHWNLSGEVITRDGDPRNEMGDNRRRSFVIAAMREIEEIPWFPPLHYAYDPGDEPAVLCKMCGGSKVVSTGYPGEPVDQTDAMECPRCGGTGEEPDLPDPKHTPPSRAWTQSPHRPHPEK